MENNDQRLGSYKNIWYGLGRQRIEIPKSILKSSVQRNPLMSGMYIGSLGFYPKAQAHFSKRKNGLQGNFLFYCVDGKGEYMLEGKKYKVSANEFFILPQNKEHSYNSNEKDPWSIYWIYFAGTNLTAFNQLLTVQSCFEPKYIKSDGEIILLFNKMYKILELGFSIDNLVFANFCLTQFISSFIYNSRYFPAIENTEIDSVEKAILYMQEKVNDTITLKELSSYSNYSVSRFSILFKQKTGYAPMDYFMQMKIQQACKLLDFSTRSIKDIAITIGFDDPYYFSKRFKQLIGVAPIKYRAIKKD